MAEPRTLPTSPKRTTRTKPQTTSPAKTVQFVKSIAKHGFRALLFGPGGIGKTTLALQAPGPVAIFDLDDSLPVLSPGLPADVRDTLGVVEHVSASSWQGILDALYAPGWDDFGTIVLDSATKGEELDTDWVIANVPHEKGNRIERIEDYGFGKGYTHIYETFLKLLAALDQHSRAGRNVILIAHDCTANVPNPQGEDFIRYEPRLQSPASGKNSIRLRVREWADHVLFIGYDIDTKDGKARGSGTRTIYPTELPFCMAKSRTLEDPIVFEKHSTLLWDQLNINH